MTEDVFLMSFDIYCNVPDFNPVVVDRNPIQPSHALVHSGVNL